MKPAPVPAAVNVPAMKAPPVQARVAAKDAAEPQEAVSVPAHTLPASPYGTEQPPPAPATYSYKDEDDADLPLPPRPARPRGYQASRD